jgi:hypothetical protein
MTDEGSSSTPVEPPSGLGGEAPIAGEGGGAAGGQTPIAGEMTGISQKSDPHGSQPLGGGRIEQVTQVQEGEVRAEPTRSIELDQ